MPRASPALEISGATPRQHRGVGFERGRSGLTRVCRRKSGGGDRLRLSGYVNLWKRGRGEVALTDAAVIGPCDGVHELAAEVRVRAAVEVRGNANRT
jgi:hypothetical protein